MKYPLYAIGALWSLPVTLVGLVLAIAYRAHSFELRAGVLTWECSRVIGGTAAQTFALVQFYCPRDGQSTRNEARLRRHENTHTLQAMVGGLVWAIAYALEFFARWPLCWLLGVRELMPDGRVLPAWKTAYRAVTWERMARGREQVDGAWGSA